MVLMMVFYSFSRNTSVECDLSSHDSFVQGPPFATFEYLRKHDPVHWTPESDGGRGFWSITNY